MRALPLVPPALATHTLPQSSAKTFPLEQNMKPFTHALGMDERLQLQARANLLGFVLSRVVEVGELVRLPQRQQKGRLRGKRRRFQARPSPPNTFRQLLGGRSGPEPSCQMYQSRLAAVRDERESTNHG